MQLFQWVSVALVAHTAVAEAKKSKCDKEFSNRVIFTPPEGSRALYPRVAELSDGTILATVSWKDPNATLAYFPIYESKDHGWTWTHISNVTDDVSDHGRCWRYIDLHRSGQWPWHVGTTGPVPIAWYVNHEVSLEENLLTWSRAFWKVSRRNGPRQRQQCRKY